MQVIYIDTLFFINLIINYLILLATAKICSIHVSRLRIAIAGVFGSIYSVFVIFPSMIFLTNPLIKIAAGIFMVLIVFGGRKGLLRVILVFFAVSAAFGGAVFAVSLLSGSSITGGGLYVPVSTKILLLSFAACYIILSVVFRRTARRRDGGGIAILTVAYESQEIRIHALIDTGNSLTDPMTGNAVVVIGYSEIHSLFSPEINRILSDLYKTNPVDTMEKLSKVGVSRFSLIPYSAVGIQCGMLLAFRPDKVTVNGKLRPGMLVALSPNNVSDGGAYSALIGA